MKRVLVGLALLLGAAQVSAEVIPATASPALNRQRIQSAIDAAASTGGTVTLGEGEFSIDGQLSVTGGVTLVGQGWEKTTLKRNVSDTNTFRIMTLNDGATVEGVTMTGGKVPDHGGGALVLNGTISWCRIIDNENSTNAGVSGGGVSFHNGQGTITHSIVANNKGNLYNRGNGIGARALAGPVLIDTCLIYGNDQASSMSYAAVTFASCNSDVTIRSCTITGNKASTNSGGIYFEGGTGGVTLIDTIVTGNLKGSTEGNLSVSGRDSYPLEVTNCFFGLAAEAATTAKKWTCANCLSGDPSFAGASSGDYRLASGSTAIGAGVTYAGIGVGLDRIPFAATPSMGCYEAAATTVAVPVFGQTSGATFVETMNVVLTCATDGATIRYTTDGSDPTGSGTVYSAPFAITETTTVKACAVKSGLTASAVVEATYTFRAMPKMAKYMELTLGSDLAATEITRGLPALVRLSESITGFSYSDFSLPNGGDLMFVGANGAVLPHEIDVWNTAGESLVWVKLPSSASGTVIRMYYGNGVTPPLDPSDVWSDYSCVLHLNESGTPGKDVTVRDSTAAGFTGTAMGIATSGSTAGAIGAGWRISDGAASETTGGILMDSMANVSLGTNFTVSAWLWHKNQAVSYDHVFYRKTGSGQTSGFASQLFGSTVTSLSVFSSHNNNTDYTIPDLREVWGHIAVAYNGTDAYVVANGVSSAAKTVTKVATDNGQPFAFGTDTDLNDRTWKGVFDEVRIRKGAYDADYLAAEYAAMNTSGTDIFSFGAPQDADPTTVKNPRFAPPDGSVFYPSANVTISSATEGATIYYTTDGSDPTTASEPYTAPIAITETTVFKALAVKAGMNPSLVLSATVTYEPPIPPELGAVSPDPRPKRVVVSGSIADVGNKGAQYCDVYFACGTDEHHLPAATKVVSAASEAFLFSYPGLAPETTYYYTLSITNDAAIAMGDQTSGSFTTPPLTGVITPVAGDPAATWRTIQNAIDDAAVDSPVGTVTLGAGLFEIDAQLCVTGGVTLIGQGRDNTVLKQVTTTASEYNRVATVGNGSTISHVTMTGGNAAKAGGWGVGGGVVMMGGTISWCCITNNIAGDSSAANNFGGGIFVTGGGDSRIDHTIVADNTVLGTSTCYGGGIGGRQFDGYSVTVDACLIYGNTVKGQGGGIGFDCTYNAKPITVRNTTIVDNEAVSGGTGGAVYTTNDSKSVFAMVNCILADNVSAGATATVSLTYTGGVDYCLFDLADDKLGANSKVGDPQFADETARDYHLSGSSPALEMGVTYTGIDEDLDGIQFKDVPSAGCYEFADKVAFGRVTVDDTAVLSAELSTEILAIAGEPGDTASVYFACSTNRDDLGAAILVKAGATVGESLNVTVSNLISTATYYYCFYGTNDVDATAFGTRSGSFMAPFRNLIKLSKLKVVPNSLGADLTVTLAKVGDGASEAKVYLAWGEDAEHLGPSVRLSDCVVEGQSLAYSIDGLANESLYAFRFVATNNLGEATQLDGAFRTLAKEQLVLEASVKDLTVTSARLAATVKTLGEHANSASVTISWGPDFSSLTNTRLLDAAATEGAVLETTLVDLPANAICCYEIVAVNDADPSEETRVRSSFMTDDPNISFYGKQSEYPSSVTAGYVVTYDADSAGDPVTLEPGNPYCEAPEAEYTYAYTSTIGAGQTYGFRNEIDFQYNASARIGYTYYLFLSDAIEKAKDGDTIELLRNNYAIGETMVITNKLTIHGNDFTVKVAHPFTETTGFVSTNCTTSPLMVFNVNNGGDVFMDHLTIMGGGQRIGSGSGEHSSSRFAVGVCKQVLTGGTSGIYQTDSTGILEMDHVTITRSQGGLFMAYGTKGLLDSCNLVRNARYCGGGLYNGGFLVMVNSSLSENRSLDVAGGGAAAENQGTLIMNNCVICNNGSTEYGGAINLINSGYIKTEEGTTTRLYLMNTTVSGNFSSYTSNVGGGIGTHRVSAVFDFQAVNSLFCNNYWILGSTVTDSDLKFDAGVNNFYYSVYGAYDGTCLSETVRFSQVDPSAQDVFKGYTTSTRVYEQAKTTVPITSATLENDPDVPLARYAPLCEGSEADVGTDGVYTYFNADDWRNGNVYFSYKPVGGTMTTVSGLAAAEESDLVTTYYESSFTDEVTDRELGVIGASGYGMSGKSYTLYLLKQPVHGSVSRNLTLNGTGYREGTSVTVVATPDSGCVFTGWYNEKDEKVSSKTSYSFVMDSDKFLYATFAPTRLMSLDVLCEQAQGTHAEFPITVTTNWLADVCGAICPGGVVTAENKAAVEEYLNGPDTGNGLNHIWQNYVLGAMTPGDPDGRIWIRADQTVDKTTLQFRMQELAKTQSCGFDVKYRLLARDPNGEDFVRTDSYASSGTFETIVTSDQLAHRVIDMIFIPDGYVTSWEYVSTVNTAGVMKVESEKHVEILATPWAGFSPTNQPAIAADGYVKASCLSVGDTLYVYDMENTNYAAWVVQEGGSWTLAESYLIVSGMVDRTGGVELPRTNALARGNGVWLQRQDVKKPICLYGQYDPSAVTTTLAPGFNLVGSPKAASFDVRTLAAPSKTGEAGDHVAIPTGSAPINCTYSADAASWGWLKEVTQVITNKNTGLPMLHPITKQPLVGNTEVWSSEGLDVPTGHGFWYYNSSSAPIELAWPSENE